MRTRTIRLELHAIRLLSETRAHAAESIDQRLARLFREELARTRQERAARSRATEDGEMSPRT